MFKQSRIFNNSTLIILLITLTWVMLSLTSLFMRPIFPIIETRYTSIAWEMWFNHHYLFPLQNGLPYPDKPPLLFWLITLGWKLFGLNNWWPRLLPSLIGYLNAWMLYAISLQLWPSRKDIQLSAFILLLGTVAWSLYSNIILFDIVLSLTVLIAIYGLLKAYLKNKSYAWIYYFLGVSLGLITKGPIVLIFILVPAFLLPLLMPTETRRAFFYCKIIILTLSGIILALAWAVPAALMAGPAFTQAIFISQTLGRIVPGYHFIHNSHSRPFWWYLSFLPFYLFPWFLFIPLGKSILFIKKYSHEPILRFLLLSIFFIFILISLIRGKQVHYLLPLIPFCILVFSYLINSGLKVTKRSLMPYHFTILIIILGLIFFNIFLIHFNNHNIPIFLTKMGACIILIYAILLFFMNYKTIEKVQVHITLSSLVLMLLLHIFVIKNFYSYYDVKPIAKYISSLQKKGEPVAFFGLYQDQFQFLGHLTMPLTDLNYQNLIYWARVNMNGWVLIDKKMMATFNIIPNKTFYYQKITVGIVSTQNLLSSIRIPMEQSLFLQEGKSWITLPNYLIKKSLFLPDKI